MFGELKVKDVDGVQSTLHRIAELEVRVEKIESNANETINRIKAQAEKEAQPILNELSKLQEALKKFALLKKNELFKKSRRLNTLYGYIGFRVKEELVWEDEQTVIKLMQKYKLDNGIGVRQPYVLKSFVKNLDDKVLAKIRVERKVEDEFQVKADHTAIQEA